MPEKTNAKYINEAEKVFQEGDDFWHAGEYDKARGAYEKSAGLFDDNEDYEGEAKAFSRLGELELSLDNHERALRALGTGANLVAEEEDSQNVYGEILTKTARVYLALDNYEKALEYTKSAEKVLDAISNAEPAGDAFDLEANIYLTMGKEKEALKAYENAVKQFQREGIEIKEASTLRSMARIEMKHKNYDVAHDLLEKCRSLYREVGDLLGEASALSAIGSLRYIIKDIENARKALMKAVYLYGKVSHHFAEAEALLYLARVESYDRESGDYDRAKAHYKRAAELFEFLGNDVMKNVVKDEYENFLNKI